MKRYASIDFLRGLAIFLMIWVHTMQRWVFREPLYTQMETYSLFVIIFLMAILWLGSWAGLFLMVSATGNMMSMQNGLERGTTVGSTIFKQIVGGTLLLLAGIISETVLGYNAYLGQVAFGDASGWIIMLWRGTHFETIQAVAWCVILNGITHGLLSIKGGWKKINRNIKIYFVLILLVVIFTPSVWEGVQSIIPGYPYEYREPFWGTLFGNYFYFTDMQLQYGLLGYDSFGYLVKLFFLAPLSGQVEPIFPFLAVSYIGSIIGLFLLRKQKEMDGFDGYDVKPMKKAPLWMKRAIRFLWFVALIGTIVCGVLWLFSVRGDPTQFLQIMVGSFMVFFLLGILLYYFRHKEKETVEYKLHTLPTKIGMMIGFALFMIGLLGVGLNAFMVDMSLIDTLMSVPFDVRVLWESGTGVFGTWLWWFCVQTGAQIGAMCLLLRVTEFRGKTHKFGERTLYFRRWGMVPFSVYNYQFIDAVPAALLALIGPIIPLSDYSSRNGNLFPAFGLDSFGVYGIWIHVALLFGLYWLILWAWQKVYFIFSFEWFLAKISSLLIPSKRKRDKKDGDGTKYPWWQAKRLNVQNALISPNWIDVVKEEHIPREELVDSKLSAKLCWMGILIAPISLISLGVARTAIKKEGKNKYSMTGLIVSIFGVLLAATILIGSMFIFGISL